VYRLPGLGLTTLSALNGDVGFDLPMILGVVLVMGLVIVTINFVIDPIVLWMDLRTAEPAPEGRSSAGAPERG
jgi:ABC-type dipeptide/oligopeptide/nickel transport system permease component